MMKKKLLILFAAVLAVLPAVAEDLMLTLGGGSHRLGFDITSETEKTVKLTGCWVDAGPVDVEIPSIVNIDGADYTVTEIAERTFEWHTGINSVVIPNSVTRIAPYAFLCCRSLTSVKLPNSITEIEHETFYDCEGLKSVIIPNSVNTIGDRAFMQCMKMETLVIGNSVTNIGDNAFHLCNKLQDIYSLNPTPPTLAEEWFPVIDDITGEPACDPITGELVFEKQISVFNDKLTGFTGFNVYVPAASLAVYQASGWGEVDCNIVAAPTGAQYVIDGLKYTVTSILEVKVGKANLGLSGDIVIPASVTIDGLDYAVTEIAASGFEDSSISSVVIPETVTTIGGYAFLRCLSLTTVLGGSGVTSIDWGAFGGCSALRSVEFGASLENIAGLAFSPCSSLEQIKLHATTPPTFVIPDGTASFKDVPSTVKVCVPYSAYDTYAATDWANVGVLQCEVQPKGSGSSADPYLVGTPEELLWISLRVNDGTQSAYFYTELTDDIDLKGRNWTPIGTADRPFFGSFDGKGHSITNMKIVATADFQGLFGNAYGYSPSLYIKNLNLAGTITTDNNIHNYIGGLVGRSEGYYGNVRNLIENVHSSVNITSDQNLAYVGGIVGYNKLSEIHRCSYSGVISLPNCNSYVGGIASTTYGRGGVIEDCIFTGSVTCNSSNNSCGGILGYLDDYINETVVVKNNLSLGTVSPHCGMIIGEAKGAIEGCMTNNYAPEGTTLYGGAQASNCQGATVTTDQLKSGEVCWLLNGSTASGAWRQTIGKDDTPVLDPMHATVHYAAGLYFNLTGDTYYALADGEEYSATADTDNCDIIYTRTFAADTWLPLYVPFSIDVIEDLGEGFTVAEINGVHQFDTDGDGALDETWLEFRTVKSGQTRPNTPYVIKSDEACEKTFSLAAGTLYAAEANSVDCSTSRHLYTLTGTYSEVTDIAGKYAMSGGQFIPGKQGTHTIKPQRFYLEISERDGGYGTSPAPAQMPACVRMMIDGVRISDEGMATAIEPVTTATAPAPAYNLQGVRVGSGYKGIVIRGGKKTINR